MNCRELIKIDGVVDVQQTIDSPYRGNKWAEALTSSLAPAHEDRGDGLGERSRTVIRKSTLPTPLRERTSPSVRSPGCEFVCESWRERRSRSSH